MLFVKWLQTQTRRTLSTGSGKSSSFLSGTVENVFAKFWGQANIYNSVSHSSTCQVPFNSIPVGLPHCFPKLLNDRHIFCDKPDVSMKFSRTDSLVQMWSFSDVSTTISLFSGCASGLVEPKVLRSAKPPAYPENKERNYFPKRRINLTSWRSSLFPRTFHLILSPRKIQVLYNPTIVNRV